MGFSMRKMGAGTMVAAAFIGPGTVTMCTLAGVGFGTQLLWAMLFSVLSTIILQEMAARIGWASERGIAEIVKDQIKHPVWKFFMVLLIISAIVIGNTAYEAGNITGASLGLQTLGLYHYDIRWLHILVGILSCTLLYIGNHKIIEKALMALVFIMSIAFIGSAITIAPSFSQIIQDMLIPSLPDASLQTVLGIIGTTIVPYNLFLHSALIKERREKDLSFADVRKDLILSICIGGLISISIIICGSYFFGQEVQVRGGQDLALLLSPLLGDHAKILIAVGLFSAGITSAITAPLAAAFVLSGLNGWNLKQKDNKFRATWLTIIILGIIISTTGIQPILLIKYAQLCNGILLPLIAGLLLWMANRRKLMTHYRNKNWQNILGFTVLLVTIGLGIRLIISVLGING